MSEALDAASGGFVFMLGVVAMGAVVGLVGWTAARYTAMALALGCAVAAVIVGSMLWTVVRWAKQEQPASRRERSGPQDAALRRAA